MPSLPPGPPPAWGPGTPARRGARARGRGRERGPQTSPRWGPRRGAHSGGRHPHPSPSAQAPVKPDPFPTRGPEGRAAYQRLAPPDSAERARAGNQGREGAQRVGGAFWGETGRCPPKAGGGVLQDVDREQSPAPTVRSLPAFGRPARAHHPGACKSVAVLAVSWHLALPSGDCQSGETNSNQHPNSGGSC